MYAYARIVRALSDLRKGVCVCIVLFALVFSFVSVTHAQELYQEEQSVRQAVVVEIVNQEMRPLPFLEQERLFQTIRAELLDGPREGEIVTVENDYLALEPGDRFYAIEFRDVGGVEYYNVQDVRRLEPLFALVVLFAAMVILLGGWKGLRSLIALAISFGAIFYILIPGLLNGWHPIVLSTSVAAAILLFAICFTHGFTRASLIAYMGTLIGVAFAGVLAMVSVAMTTLSGFGSDDAVFLNVTTQGSLDFVGLLVGAIIIGMLGVLDDIAVTQVAIVQELKRSASHLSKRDLFLRSLHVGREHASALVNTLVLAYTGVALPLLLLLYLSPNTLMGAINMEVIATEIVRTVVGSIGLIITVPIVTLLAVAFLRDTDLTAEHGHVH